MIFDNKSDNPNSLYSFARDEQAPKAIEIRALCELLWQQFEPYADSTLLTDIPNHFESKFWEMDLTCALLNHGYNISSDDEGPNVLLTQRHNTVHSV